MINFNNLIDTPVEALLAAVLGVITSLIVYMATGLLCKQFKKWFK